MCAYNKVNGDYACESRALLTTALKDDWHYPYWTMSDWGALHSTEKGALEGLDQESGQELDEQPYFGAAIANGRVPGTRLDDMVRRILTGMIANGLLDDPVPSTPVPIDYLAHADVAQRAAEAGMVLLKNDRALLPLAKTAQRILLIGAHADVGVLSGGGSSQVRSVGGVPIELLPPKGSEAAGFARITWHASSPLAAIRAAVPGARIDYVDGTDVRAAAAAAERNVDTVILFARQWLSEAQDGASLSLPDNQDALIRAVTAANPRTAVVLETGGPVTMPWLAGVSAVLEAWYPGQRGGPAIARVLFGDVAPSGRLPVTFPSDAGQTPRPRIVGADLLRAADARRVAGSTRDGGPGSVPAFAVDYTEGANVGYRRYEATGRTPLFPFGYGLSYTSFNYANIEVASGRATVIEFDVTNTGSRTGAEVSQVYMRAPGSAADVTYRLVGWSKLTLAPGSTSHVKINVDRRLIAHFDVHSHSWRIDGGNYSVAVSRFAGNRALVASVGLKRQTLRP